ncbi:MliC family protein [Alysiella filiformis]|uniref:Membrane-bound lysozyme-inhibitor of c-type lysozyme n=1 Tax=Alysiella filiformis DSM 16848 TaxID=1120981 RepID=A0A286EF32_9NEIS|nr:MliC family protein [Alysiella filiformis]QMT31752.1 MliC family protein [Alysiella filiformis]UBQ55236.1 MliC family protein [Alysiella filiformis DSM 16848]SOD69525.1 Membrane-bound lysozyme-inhibitor of c-type lysozyme [Alysiella filiformis DSM 16848]
MQKRVLCLIASALALAACTHPQAPVSTSTSATPTPTVAAPDNRPIGAPNAATQAPDQVFSCRNGATLTVRHNVGTDKIRLFVNTIESSTILSAAPAGSGVRYTNDNGFYNRPTEFHFKGKEGNFSFQDPYGNKVNTTCRSK